MQTPKFSYPTGNSYPVIDTPDGQLQIWSGENDNRRPDVFQLEDGRVCRINIPTTASMERDCFAVEILAANRLYGERNHRRLLGTAGLMYRSRRSLTWELYPVERNVTRHQRPADRILSSAVSARAAALALIVASDEATGTLPGYAIPARSHKVGNWHVQALPTRTGNACPKPGKGDRRADAAGVQFLVTRGDHSAIVLVRSDRVIGGGWDLVAEKLPLRLEGSTWEPGRAVDVPESVLRFCLERCRCC